MKPLFFSILSWFIFLASINAQTELEKLAPVNPHPYMDQAPIEHSFNGTITSIEYYWQEGKLQHTLFYNEDGVVDKMYNPQDTKYSLNTYNSRKNKEGQLIEENRIDTNNETKKHTYTYDEKGRLASFTTWKERQVRKGSYRTVEDKTINYTYDDQGRLISSDNTTYDYEVEGKLLKVTVKGKYGSQTIYKFDKWGRKVFYHYQSSYGTKNPITYTYVTDQKCNPIARKSSEGKYDEVKIYHYADGSQSELFMKDIDVDWAHDDTSFKWNGYSNGLGRSQGFYKNGKLEGPGWRQAFGKREEGEFKNDKLHGYGLIKDLTKENSIIAGTFNKGKLDGYAIKIENKEIVEAGIYKNGKLVERFDLTTALSNSRCDLEKCPEGVVRVKTPSFLSNTYTFIKNKKPIGPLIEVGNGQHMVAFFDEQGIQFASGTVQGRYVVAHMNNNAMNGLGYLSAGKNYQAGEFENNKLVKSLIK